MRLLLLPLVLFITPVALSEDYVWKSKAEPIDYKCVVERKVGFDWEDGSRFLEFDSKGYKDIFLTHISNLPVGSMTPFIPPFTEPPSLNERRSDMEEHNFRNLLTKGVFRETTIKEEGSYFMRNEDLKHGSSLSKSCVYTDSASTNASIDCFDSRSTFSFNTGTKRFSQSLLGGWHLGLPYASVLSYGTCRKYFR